MKTLTTATKSHEDDKSFELTIDDRVVTFRQPKDILITRVLALFEDKYAPDSAVARAAFDFVLACLVTEDASWLLARVMDQDDDFDTEDFGDVAKAMLDTFLEEQKADEQVPVNRTARRQAQRTT